MHVVIDYNKMVFDISMSGLEKTLDLKTEFSKTVLLGDHILQVNFKLDESNANNPKIILILDGEYVKYTSIEKIGNPFNLFLIGSIPGYFIHKATGNHYKATGFCSFKNPETREWIPSIMYTRSDIISELYVREIPDFLTKFKRK